MPEPMYNVDTPQNQTSFSYLRFLQAAPIASGVDIYMNQEQVAKNISYKNFTNYLKVAPGIYNITIYPTGTNTTSLLFSRINLSESKIFTAAITGLSPEYTLELISDRSRSPRPNTAYLRFIALSPNAPDMDILIDNRLFVSDLMYREVTNYIALHPGSHSILFRDTKTGKILLEDPSARLKNGNFYACYIIGNAYASPGLQVLIPLEGTSYLQL